MLLLYINPTAVDDVGEDNERKQTGLTSCPCCKGISDSSHLPWISHCNLDIEEGLNETIGALMCDFTNGGEFHLWPNTRLSNRCTANLLIGEEAGMATTMGIQDLHDPRPPQ
ncbi:hypothetical protein K439DRAFT_1635143 [Ramaria rubella]|nr:hypothetical protein K439DRAFT_1635143 [Ramaria rubella]